MQIGRSRLSPGERERRFRAGDCLYCGRRGHRRLSSAPIRVSPPVSPGIRLGSTLSSTRPRLLLNVAIVTHKTTFSCCALIDSGAEQNLMDTQLAEKLDLPLLSLEPPIPASALNNQVIEYITHQTALVKLVPSGTMSRLSFLFSRPLTCPSSWATLGCKRIIPKSIGPERESPIGVCFV